MEKRIVSKYRFHRHSVCVPNNFRYSPFQNIHGPLTIHSSPLLTLKGF